MKQKDHRRITEEVAKRIAPRDDLTLLVRASGELPDVEKEASCSHHSTTNIRQVSSSIGKARRELLRHGFSNEFQRSLGYALHYIQDLLAISIRDRSLHGESLSRHDEIESKLSKYTDSVAYEGINPEPLEGEDEVLSFVRENIECVCKDTQRALDDPEEALERCFKTCLSVASAVCGNEKGFSKGGRAVEVSDNIKRLMKRIRERLDAMPEALNETGLRTQKYVQSLEAVQEAKQWRRPFVQEIYYDAWFKSDLRKLREMESWEKELSETVSKLNELIESSYEQEYKIRQDNLGWYGLKRTEFRTEFRTVQELRALVSRANKELSQAETKRRELELRVQDEMARIDTTLMENRIEKLLDSGRMGLDEGYCEQARKCFEQVLRLDASSQEAIDGLARIDNILRRRTAAPVEPIQVERVEPPRKIERKIENRIEELLAFGRIGLETGYYEQAQKYFNQVLALDPTNQGAIDGLAQVDEILSRKRAAAPIEAEIRTRPPSIKRISLRANFALEWMRKKREERAREIARQREEIARREEEKAKEVEKLKQAWAEQREQRGNVPLQLGQCPECGSIDANKYKNVSGVGCLALLLTFPFSLLVYPLLPNAYRCKVCGARWRG